MAYTPKNPNGQATMANSSPVVLASDQTDVKITLDSESVTIGSSALPTGAATAANQTTIIGHVDGIEGLLTTIDADTSNLSVVGSGTEATAIRVTIATDSTGVLSIDDNGSTISIDDGGGAITVDGSVSVTGAVDTELPTAAALADNTSNPTTTSVGVFPHWYDGATWDRALGDSTNGLLVNLGSNNDVTVTGTVAATQSGTWTLGANSGVDIGDVTINNASGASAVNIQDGGNSITVDGSVTVSGSLTSAGNVTNTGTFAVQATVAAGATNIAKAEDVASADADVGVPAMAVRKATPANTSGTDGDYEMLQISAGRLWTSAVIDTALPAGTNAIGKLAANSGVDIGDVDVTSIIPGTGATNLGKAEDAVHATGDTGVMALGVGNVAQSTFAADGDYMPIAVDTKGNVMVGGNIAHDGADAGNPVKIGGKARQTNPTAVADADRADLVVDDIGRIVTADSHVRDLVTQQVTTITSSTSETTILTAGAAGVYHDVKSIMIANKSASATLITIRDATAGSAVAYIHCPAGDTRGVVFTTPFKQTTAANNWTAQAGTSVDSLYITVQAVKNI